MAVTAEEVRNAYRYILGREPENADVVEAHCRGHADYEHLRRAFLASDEASRSVRPLPPTLPLDAPPLQVETVADAATLDVIVRQTATYWSTVGEKAPHWSVVTDPRFTADRIAENEALFFDTGRGDLALLIAALARAGRDPAEFPRVLEYGCGVGRLTGHLAGCFGTVQALDISPPHLRLARAHLAQLGHGNVTFHQVTPAALHPGDAFDLWFTRIVLQHNPPPVIHRILDLMLLRLAPRGIAVFQVPTYRAGYRFTIADYLAAPLGRDMEMHVMPQQAVLELVWRHGCRLVEIREDTPVVANSPEWLSNTFVVEKPL